MACSGLQFECVGVYSSRLDAARALIRHTHGLVVEARSWRRHGRSAALNKFVGTRPLMVLHLRVGRRAFPCPVLCLRIGFLVCDAPAVCR